MVTPKLDDQICLSSLNVIKKNLGQILTEKNLELSYAVSRAQVNIKV